MCVLGGGGVCCMLGLESVLQLCSASDSTFENAFLQHQAWSWVAVPYGPNALETPALSDFSWLTEALLMQHIHESCAQLAAFALSISMQRMTRLAFCLNLQKV